MDDRLFAVGSYVKRFNDLTGQDIPCGTIYQSPGLRVHVENHHPDKVSFLGDIPDG